MKANRNTPHDGWLQASYPEKSHLCWLMRQLGYIIPPSQRTATVTPSTHRLACFESRCREAGITITLQPKC